MSGFDQTLLSRIRKCGVIAVLVVDDARRAVRLARALVEGGVDVMELTLRTPAALECLRAVTAEVPGMIAGAGTILTTAQLADVQRAGAAFGVAPGTNRTIIRAAADCGLPFAPGVMTPSDIDAAVECGSRVLKFFPAEPSGGRAMLASIKAPFAHLGLQYIPLGGITSANCAEWLADPDVPAVGGSWLAPKSLIDAERWDDITTAAREARRCVDTRLV